MDVSDQGGVPPARIGNEQRVTPLELFFDLVFVFALTQVTGADEVLDKLAPREEIIGAIHRVAGP